MKLRTDIVCPNGACPRCAACARHQAYLKAKASEETFTVLNTELITSKADGCPHLLYKENQRIAYGFTKLLAEVPKKYLNYLYCRFPYQSQSSYDRRRRGLYGLSPAEQACILNIFKQYGVDTSIGFDRYREEEVYVEPQI